MPGNAVPELVSVIPDQVATVGTVFSYEFPAATFSDPDGGTLTYTAARSDDSRLPAWLSFAAAQRTFTGTPQSGDVETVSVKVTASDPRSGMVSDTFDIVVSATVPGVPGSFTATADDTEVVLAWTAPESDGGAAVEKYQYRYSEGSAVDENATTATWTDVDDGDDADSDAGNETGVTVGSLDNRHRVRLRGACGEQRGRRRRGRSAAGDAGRQLRPDGAHGDSRPVGGGGHGVQVRRSREHLPRRRRRRHADLDGDEE